MKYLGHVSDFAAWACAEGIPLSERHLLDLDVIERYIAVGMPGAADSTGATRRAILRRVARKVSPDLRDLPAPEPIAYRRVRAPYTPS